MKDDLGNRMKIYESSFKHALPPRLPVVIRLDGKSFHTYTKQLKKENQPFDAGLENVMNLSAIKLCEEIQGAQMAYVQSDEISILLHNYKRLNSHSWFGNEIQKIVSVSASIASSTFSINSYKIWKECSSDANLSDIDLIRPAYFDSRVFILPESEVCNYMIWRLKDCRRNSVSLCAQNYFSSKQLYKKSNEDKKEMLRDIGHDWDCLPNNIKNGRVIIKKENIHNRRKWSVENNFPLFWEDRQFVNNFLLTKE